MMPMVSWQSFAAVGLFSLIVALIWGDRVLRVAALGLGGLWLACYLAMTAAEPVYQAPALLSVEVAGLALFLGMSLQVDRRFPFALAAIALIGLMARAVELLGVVSASVGLLTLPRVTGLVAVVILLLATASHNRRQRYATATALPRRPA